MHIAIDDTYGPEISGPSRHVTGRRRTYAAVLFDDENVEEIRAEMRGLLEMARVHVEGTRQPKEFHFVDIYNRSKDWKGLPGSANLGIFEFFAAFYKAHRWEVFIQTVDDRTLRDHGRQDLKGEIGGLNLSERDDQALFFLLFKLRQRLLDHQAPVTLVIDEGRGRPGKSFGTEIFRGVTNYKGSHESSAEEPLLQIADFIAFCVNRSAHLCLKPERTETDLAFLDLVGGMGINCADILRTEVDPGFTVKDFDRIHDEDRRKKGLT